MIESIVPAEVVGVESFDDPADATLFPEEEAVIAKAVEKRRREFTTVRMCARRAFAKLGVDPAPILPGDRGEPQWPAGLVGSMTHCAGYRGAVVAPSTEIVTVGIDAEPNQQLPDGVLGVVSLPEEREWIEPLLAQRPDVHWDRLLFSAKESVYKAWFPLAKKMLGFEQARLTVDPDAGTFSARLLVPGPDSPVGQLSGFEGRWLAQNGLVITAIAVPSSR